MRWHPVDAEHSFPAGAQLFTDGSCFEGRDPRTATAGFAVVWLDQGQVKKGAVCGSTRLHAADSGGGRALGFS
eukprot:11466162-Prorocentrum_lima.AAC.1